jgi:hypothetical protein
VNLLEMTGREHENDGLRITLRLRLVMVPCPGRIGSGRAGTRGRALECQRGVACP